MGVTQSNRAPRITHTPNLGTYTSDRNFNPFWGPTKRIESTFSLVLFLYFVSSVHFFMIFFLFFGPFLCDMSLFAPSFPFSPSRRWRGNNLTYNHIMQCAMLEPSSNHIMQCTSSATSSTSHGKCGTPLKRGSTREDKTTEQRHHQHCPATSQSKEKERGAIESFTVKKIKI